jgi:hypothetical protein
MIHLFQHSFLNFEFRPFSWLSLNNLLRLTGLERASTSASNAAFTGVSIKTALTLGFRFRISLRASAFGKGLISTGLT